MKPRIIFLILPLLVTQGCDSPGGSRHERHGEVIEESAKLNPAISGGEPFKASLSYDKTYEAILTFLKTDNHVIETANKETGQIVTAMEIEGGWRQTGTRIIVTLIKDGESSTSVKIVVSEQKRFKALQIEPWGEAKVNAPKSLAISEKLKSLLTSSH